MVDDVPFFPGPICVDELWDGRIHSGVYWCRDSPKTHPRKSVSDARQQNRLWRGVLCVYVRPCRQAQGGADAGNAISM